MNYLLKSHTWNVYQSAPILIILPRKTPGWAPVIYSSPSLSFYFLLRIIEKNINTFFYKQRFFSNQPQCCLAISWTELQMLLSCCLIHISIIIVRHFLFTVFVFMTSPRSIYIVSMRCIFHFHLHFHYDLLYNLMNTDTLVLLLIFKNMSYYFWMKNVNNFQIAKI